MDLIRRISKSGLIVLVVFSGAAAFFEWKRLPMSIMTGGVLGLVNLRGLSRSVEGLLGSERATGKMIFFSIFRLTMLFFVIGALVYMKLVDIIGLLIGFTVIFCMIIVEGLRAARRMQSGEKS